jgi:hypothetical protein
MGNLGTLAIGILLIIGVLFLGFKMDTSSSKGSKNKKVSKEPKAPKKKEKVFDIEESNDEEDISDMPYESDDDEVYEHDVVNQADLVEDSEYEDEDVSVFHTSNNVESSFNNDVDDQISFESEEDDYEEEEEDVPNEPVVRVEDEEEEEEEDDDDFSSTMIFDTEKINGELEEIDRMDQEEYSKPTVNVEETIKKVENVKKEPVKETVTPEPIQSSSDDAESFMKELKKMQEAETVDDFSGFAVEKEDKELKETHRRYTKKKAEDKLPEVEVPQLSFDNVAEVPEEPASSQMDMNFLAQMEENLKKNQEERLSKKTTTTRKTTKKKE